ncbi:uncharacterized protein Z520_06084 [Fonsecaea multimorphosa CBS 102226]|uniref:5'-3' DNA helicase ZGRF1-like N-terminal domain-containing protein n=1 Tax=Fonsecaea multimorphosa CBS 102226 TaxID=1442371 RepID=A0A0D2H833_9EURO|nr:uncharacterized protein Z520_06084 [Fonsecaea multimorphosa CBS 102226]KIX98005.1 hypothetical protein Z520_06084 [Fonsecaea multimorphosa CBS 102226]OAL24374.1 hypothetical protein AYO22_05750 [Fonsecaea multimorphosa]
MATLTSTHRGFGSASLTVAPTQNTAPVHEFRCLYTRDLHKKAKKWHDGSLRFHTFNRRVMVYDDAKNYIGDLHYRQEEEFAEGVEIQLDRGVLVEVGERLGETQTDLAPILERSRPEKPPPPQQPTAMANRPLSAGPSQRPKSLLEVLGPSQGRLGRARLPANSPYEQRWSSSRAALVGSPRKRQRLDCDKENQFDQVHQPVRPARPRLPQPMQPSKTVPQTPRRAGSPVGFEEFIELSSGEEPKQQPKKSTRLGSGVVENQTGLTPEEQRLTPALARARSSLLPQPEDNGSKGRMGKERQKKSNAPQKPKTTANDDSSNLRPQVARTSRLLIGQPRPRPKLTCVLPFSKGTSRSQTLRSSCPRSPQVRASSPFDEDVSLLPRQAVNANVDDCVQPIQVSCSGQSSVHGSVQEENGSFSPLFIPEENPESNSPSPRPLPTQEEFPIPGSDKSQLSQSPPKPNSPSPRPLPTQEEFPLPGSDNSELPQSPPNPSVVSSAQAQPVSIPAPQLDKDARPSANDECPRPQAPLVVHPQVPYQPDLSPGRSNSSDIRQFRRVFSENDAVADDAFTLRPEPAAPQARSPLGVLGNLAARKSPLKSKSPSTLQRCASDTNALDTDNHLMEGLTEEGTKGSTGPWTEDEAFLLFDWWPADMEKPVYWKETEEHVLPRIMPAAVPDVRAGITTARQFRIMCNDING